LAEPTRAKAPKAVALLFFSGNSVSQAGKVHAGPTEAEGFETSTPPFLMPKTRLSVEFLPEFLPFCLDYASIRA
jgi:hypothetical protein